MSVWLYDWFFNTKETLNFKNPQFFAPGTDVTKFSLCKISLSYIFKLLLKKGPLKSRVVIPLFGTNVRAHVMQMSSKKPKRSVEKWCSPISRSMIYHLSTGWEDRGVGERERALINQRTGLLLCLSLITQRGPISLKLINTKQCVWLLLTYVHKLSSCYSYLKRKVEWLEKNYRIKVKDKHQIHLNTLWHTYVNFN